MEDHCQIKKQNKGKEEKKKRKEEEIRKKAVEKGEERKEDLSQAVQREKGEEEERMSPNMAALLTLHGSMKVLLSIDFIYILGF